MLATFRSMRGAILALLLAACPTPTSAPDAGATQLDAGTGAPVWVRIFHTSDEHGGLQPIEDSASSTVLGCASLCLMACGMWLCA